MSNEPESGRNKWVITNSELRVPPRCANGLEYMLHIARPYSYETEPERRYPVFYLLDAYWDFTLISAIYGHLLYDGVIPEFLLAGVGYHGLDLDYHALRNADFCEEPVRFVEILERELIPFVDSNFRTDPSYRVLGGASTGASFTLSTLFSRPDLFQGYIAIAPTDPSFLALENRFATTLPLRLHIACGTEDVSGAQETVGTLIEQLELHQHPSLSVELLPVEEARHAGAKPHGYSRGLAFAFAPRVA